MKNTLILFTNCTLLLLSFSSLNGQQLTFNKVVWDSLGNGIQCYDVVQDIDNGFIIIGENVAGGGLIMKTDSSGSLIWNKIIDYSGYTSFQRIIPTNDSCFLIAGNKFTNHGDAFLVKINSTGDTLWTRLLDKAGYDLNPFDIKQTFDSGYVVSGEATGNTSLIFNAKLSTNGALQWINFLDSGSIGYGTAIIKQTPDSGFLVVGSAFMIKLSPAGTVLWSKEFRCHDLQVGCVIINMDITNSGIFLYVSFNAGAAIIKTDLMGNVLWTKSYSLGGYNNYSEATLIKTLDNEYVFCTAGDVVKIDTSGTMIWETSLDLNISDLIKTRDKGFLVIGNGPLITGSPSIPNTLQIGLIKIDSLGHSGACFYNRFPVTQQDTAISLSASLSTSTVATMMSYNPVLTTEALVSDSGCVLILGDKEVVAGNVLSISPNPSNSSFTVYSDQEVKNGEIDIFNTWGQKIYNKIVNGNQTIINTKLSSGIYFVRIIDKSKSWSAKIIRE